STGRLGDADIIALALSTVALILARLRMIDGFWSSRSTSWSVIAATLATLKLWNASRKASRLPKTIDQLSPASNTPRVSASNMADSSYVRAPQTSSWYRLNAVSPAPAQAHRALPSYPMITSSLIWVFAVPPATTESLAFNLPVEAPGAMR